MVTAQQRHGVCIFWAWAGTQQDLVPTCPRPLSPTEQTLSSLWAASACSRPHSIGESTHGWPAGRGDRALAPSQQGRILALAGRALPGKE